MMELLGSVSSTVAILLLRLFSISFSSVMSSSEGNIAGRVCLAGICYGYITLGSEILLL